MFEKDAVICIYHYLSAESVEGEGNSSGREGYYYYFLYAFDQSGLISPDVLLETYFEKFQSEINAGEYIGPFNNLDELNQYAFVLMEKLDAGSVYSISVQEYNAVIEESENVMELLENLIKHANGLKNIEKTNRSKGLFGKIFQS